MSGPSFINLKFEGAEDLEKALRGLGSDPAIRKALKDACVEALEPIAADARARARRRTGRMAEGIDVKAQLSRRQRAQRSKPVGPDGAEAFVGAAPMGPAVLEEFGTAERHWKSGKSTGSQPAFPFMRPAWEAGWRPALDTFGKLLWASIAKVAKRLAAKQQRLLSK